MSLRNDIKRFLDNSHIQYQENTDLQLFVYSYQIQSKIPYGKQFIFVREDGFIVETTLPLQINKDDYPSLIEFFTRANVLSEIGYFQLNKETGYISHVMKVIAFDSISQQVIHNACFLPLKILGEYGFGTAIFYLLNKTLTPQQAIDFIDRSDYND